MMSQWIYLSPHLDDVALSLGGLLWEQTQAGERVSVWTICAGDAPPGGLSSFAEGLHQRWETGRAAVAARRAEDAESCKILGAAHRHFPIPDCIYRLSPQSQEYLYTSEAALFGPLHLHENSRIDQIGEMLRSAMPAGAQLVCPLGLGGHVDHRLTRAAAEKLGRALWYYADYPYVLNVSKWPPKKLAPQVFSVPGAGVQAWQAAVAAHHSQINTFWESTTQMQAAIAEFAAQNGGVTLWRE